MPQNMSDPQGPYRFRKPRKVFNPSSLRPKQCEIVESATGVRRQGTDIFPSRKQAKKALAKIIPTLPKRESPEELNRYYIRNV